MFYPIGSYKWNSCPNCVWKDYDKEHNLGWNCKNNPDNCDICGFRLECHHHYICPENPYTCELCGWNTIF